MIGIGSFYDAAFSHGSIGKIADYMVSDSNHTLITTSEGRAEAAALVNLVKAFEKLKTYEAAWKWLWHSKHKDARNTRALMYLLVNWPFQGNIPWSMLTSAIDEIIYSCEMPEKFESARTTARKKTKKKKAQQKVAVL